MTDGRIDSRAKPVILSPHAQAQLAARGGTLGEVESAIRASEWAPAERGRLRCQQAFKFDRVWNSRSYKSKIVRPIFVDEPDAIVIMTVYVFYSQDEV